MTQPTFHRAALALLLMIPAASVAWADEKLTPDDLVGGYTIVSGEKFGKKEPEDRIKGTTVRFTRDAVVITTPDKQEAYAASYKLDAGRSPARITLTSKLAPSEGEVARGLVEKDGDTVRLIYALPGGEEPTGFKTQERQLLFVMKNLKK